MQKKHHFKQTLMYPAVLLAILSGLSVPGVADNHNPVNNRQSRRSKVVNALLLKNAHVKKNIIYASVDETDLKLDIFTPQKTDVPLPLVVWIHGGGWRTGSKDNCPALPLLTQGFAVASINYRLTDVARFPAQIHDCKAAIRFLRANADEYAIDPNRIGVWGASAGGHLAALLGTTNGNKELEGTLGKYPDASSDVQAVCDWFGPSDFLRMPVNLRQFKNNNPVDALLGDNNQNRRPLAELASPVSHVTKDAPPFLIMHGDQDTVVHVRQSQMLYDRLKAEAVDTKLIIIEGGKHGLREHPECLKSVIDFFRRTLIKPEKEKPEVRTQQTQ